MLSRLRFARKCTYTLNVQLRYFCDVRDNTNVLHQSDNPRIPRNEILNNRLDSFKDKIIYSSKDFPKHYLEIFKRKRELSRGKYTDQNTLIKDDVTFSKNNKLDLPYQHTVKYDEKEIIEDPNSTRQLKQFQEDDSLIRVGAKWMNDYEKFCEDDLINEDTGELDECSVNYGTADPSRPVSDVACGGCGAYLHCKEPSVPGYLPSEIFSRCNKSDLHSILCQRCHFLSHYNTALDIQVDPNDYPKLLSRIPPEALVVLLIDLTDFTGSLWPNITEVLGRNRQLFLVGNKIDLLWGDGVGWLKRVAESLYRCVPPGTKIVNTSLISAKTGFGVEGLVSKLHAAWRGTGDVYLVGCTNVGKSSLFNILIQSDYCKTKAVDLVRRATTAPWPGTTLNLLRFPIMRPASWRVALRNQRLIRERSNKAAEAKLLRMTYNASRKRLNSPPLLYEDVRHSFKNFLPRDESGDIFTMSGQVKEIKEKSMSLINYKEHDFDGRWCYDTPGVMHKEQILDLLTTEEILTVIPKSVIVPRTYLLYTGNSLLLGCLGRLDYIKGERASRVTVFSNEELPVTICNSEDALEIYQGLLRSGEGVVPKGGPARLKEWPGLSSSNPLTLCGISENHSCADITLSSAGWISVTPHAKDIVTFVAWTPFSRGISVRVPSLLPFAVALRGKKIPRSPAYSRTRVSITDYYESKK